MSKILLVTIGGSFQPIVTAIRSLQPDRVIFIASDGDKGSKSQVIGADTPCEIRRGAEIIERLPNIPTQVELGDKFQPERDLILIQNPDNLGECYLGATKCIRELQQNPDIHHIDFELEVKPGIELSDEIWDKVQDLVIDCEWKLRDESGEKWYFHPQRADNLTCHQDSQIIVNSNQLKNVEVGIKI